MVEKKLLDYFNGDELAASTWNNKYAIEGEVTPDDMHKRMAKEFARIEGRYDFQVEYTEEQIDNLSDYGLMRMPLTQESIYKLFKDFKYIIPQGSIMSNLGAKEVTSLSNCFVIGQPEDSYGGIFEKDEQMAQLMKRRGGVGLDISTLRPEGTVTTNSAKTSTGAVSFMNRFSNTTREVAQNGRRGALMLSMSINHPDVLDFIKIKRDLTKITGANISVKINNEFMEAVKDNEEYILRFPCDMDVDGWAEDLTLNELKKIGDGKYYKKVKAKEYWDEIIKSAHSVSEAGIIFEDNHINYSPDGVYDEYRGVTTNPCGEIFMQPYDACRLIALNLFSFVEKPFSDSPYFNIDKFYRYTYEAMRLSDALIDLEIEHIDRILDKISKDRESDNVKATEYGMWVKIKETALSSRRTGLGFTALGDTLAALGLRYDSDEALEAVELIMETKMMAELDCTIDLGILRGSFKDWDFEKESGDTNNFYKFLKENFNHHYIRMLEYGRRNVSWSTVAPTGTVSLLAQTTSGLEPLFQPFYTRRRKISKPDERVDFTDDSGDKWTEFPVLHPKFEEWIRSLYNGDITSTDKFLNENIANIPLKGEILESFIVGLDTKQLKFLFTASPWYKATANDIDWIKRVKMQGIIQSYTTHSISSTINLPEDVSEGEVSDIYLAAWEKGLKGITVYREGSRAGVLITDKEDKKETFEYKDAVRRPKKLKADVHFSTLKGEKFTVVVGLLDGKPYETFITGGFLSINKDNEVTKKEKGVYETKEGLAIAGFESPEFLAITRLISTSLRHGADIRFIVEQLNKIGDMFSFARVISRVLKRYIPEGSKSTVSCLECGSEEVIFEEGCSRCLSCASSKCG